ncbi:Tyrosine-protein phosphatase 1 [Spathaspora sp. JA1]|nr:Tyrosine-protein phosphatase 1 [Spathaspora sp. JA1]
MISNIPIPSPFNRISPFFKKQPNPPIFLKLTHMNQREKFNELNELEADRIQDALDHPDSSIWSLTQAMKRTNKTRNRYSNVFPWNESRIVLPVKDGNEFSDYINASRIKLSLKEDEQPIDEYIACQGPLENTFNHFWSMCFNESEIQNNDTSIIVMVTPLTENGMVKCARYWPELNETWDFSSDNIQDGINIPNLTITNKKETFDSNEDYIITELELVSDDKIKTVYHYYYFKWIDAKVPPSIEPLYKISEDIANIKSTMENNLPVPIVHCSAGVGRSGTFIAFDHLFSRGRIDQFIQLVKKNTFQNDLIYRTVYQLRSQRMMMVQTIHQYNFLYEVAKVAFDEHINRVA